MKAIINGHRYDTEAKFTRLIASAHSIEKRTSYAYWEEDLYRTNHGTWFLHGRGHGATSYGTDLGNNLRGRGERIVPLDPERARAWLERHGYFVEIKKYFDTETTNDY